MSRCASVSHFVFAIVTLFAFACTSVVADVVIETVSVGNPGNIGEWSGESYGGFGPDRISGAVDYQYNIGKYEVTAGQYTEFLNAVAATDTYGLYNIDMQFSGYTGCGIQRSGSSGSYAYSIASNWANRPVNLVSWGDAARFTNWLHNGRPTGVQGLGTTEDGAYYLNGATTGAELTAVNRESDWAWAIPTEDEWYKAAYHKNDGVTGNYFNYPTSNDNAPSNDLVEPIDPGNNATYFNGSHVGGGDYTIDAPYYRTVAGAHENSGSPYGTYDQGGNVTEWTEEALYASYRGKRGGSFDENESPLRAAERWANIATHESRLTGFRVVQIPEPTTLSLLALGSLLATRRRP